ncbi:hypothetical protein [Ensifer adhaerens]|uniref:hypothetical protein n=1 Tax=Ensifer adhaerens TaxID=106592 RepID=UPI000CF12A09|nr:hypothetical protein [Ensifer adhaerens]
MWKAFAVLYGLIFIFGLSLAFVTLPPEIAVQLSSADRALFYAGLAVEFAAMIGAFAYAFDLRVPPSSFWRPFSWALAGWCLYTSLDKAWDVAMLITSPKPGDEGLVSAVFGLLLLLLLNYFAWLGVWRYGRQTEQQPAPTG